MKAEIDKNDITQAINVSIEEKIITMVEDSSRRVIAEFLNDFEKKFFTPIIESQTKQKIADRELEREKLLSQKQIQLETIKSDERKYRKDRFWKLIGVIVSIGGFLLYWNGSKIQETANNKRAYDQHQIDLIREDIKEKKEILNSASKAIGNLRLVDDDIIRNCRFAHPYLQEKQDKMRRVSRQKIADSFAVVPIVFGESALNQARYLLQSEMKIKDVCTYKGDLDEKLIKDQRKIFDLIQVSIENNRKTIEKLR